ncbi:ABC transporter type 1, transmembrane domain-containing protein [Pisolithus sp. B1]|nr:ABC transporter type 1, transmembrane domain-containing protein [Pisolithus sp. B1]
MPEYQLPIAGALAVTAVGSLVLLLRRPQDEGKIQLPTHGEDNDSLLHDPFDVTKPEDVTDGYPIDEEKFWSKARLWKVVACLLLSMIVVLQAIALGWTFVVDDKEYNKYAYVVHSIYAFYVTIIAGRAVYRNTVDAHATYIIHLATLTFVPTILFFAVAILPSSRPFSVDPAQDIPFLLWTSYAVLLLYFIATYVIFTIPMGPPLHFPPEAIYSEKIAGSATNPDQNNVCVVMLGYTSESLEIGDLPIVPGNMRATYLYASMRKAIRTVRWRLKCWKPKIGSGWQLGYQLLRVNILPLMGLVILAMVSACLFYTAPFFLKMVVSYLESDPERRDRSWGWFYVAFTGQLWSIATTTIQVRLRTQLNTVLFGKTLVRKDVASSSSTADRGKNGDTTKDDEDDFSSKAQIMTLMTTDVDRVSDFSWHMFSLVDSPIEIVIGTVFLYNLLGVSCFIGLAVTCLFLPLNHYGGKVVVRAQESLMKTRDERVALMNEILGAIRMLKFMAWERSFERKVLAVREKELRYQKLSYMIEVLFNALWDGSPIFVTIVAFWHFAVVRGQTLTPSIAFTSILVFNEMKFALNALPETFINMLQSFVSLRRIEKYMNAAEVTLVPPLSMQTRAIAFQNATITWPQDRVQSGSATPSVAPTPRHKFVLLDLALSFPEGKLSLVTSAVGKLIDADWDLALLGEADVLAGQVVCPRSPPDALAQFAVQAVAPEEWVAEGICAYVPQSAWLRNASIKDNILFNLPYDEERYQKTLAACALVSDLLILEDGDASEIGERGVNLSGGQKARVSLARAVYSRASVLFLDDVLSAVDAHTAHHLYHQCLNGDLMRGRTIILVSHHVQLCMSGASYIVALDNGRVIFQGDRDAFQASDVVGTLVHSGDDDAEEKDKDTSQVTEAVMTDATSRTASVLTGEEIGNTDLGEATVVVTPTAETEPSSETSSTAFTPEEASKADKVKDRKAPRKLIEEERRAVGHIKREIWETYIRALGGWKYWSVFVVALILGALSPILENWWLKTWSGADPVEAEQKGPVFYITIYAAVTLVGLFLNVFRFYVLYTGSINASTILYKRLLETILFANIRFHDTVSRGRLLNRFGKDFEGIDSKTADNFGRSVFYGLAALTTLVTVSVVGGIPFICAGLFLGYMYYSVAKVYGQTARDMRRLDSVTRSPLYSIYGETIAGVTILRAFGASSMFLRDMIRCVDTNANPYYWMWGVNRWLSTRFNLLSCALVGLTGFVAVLSPSISAALAGFALTFASNVTHNLLFLVRRFVGLEQSMVALERVKEYSELKREPAEFIEPRPDSNWPEKGHIKCEDLVIRYAPDLPDVLHHINFEIMPGEKNWFRKEYSCSVSSSALSRQLRGGSVIDDVDISKIGLTDLRGRLTIIPQDPTILSGTLRSTLDVFDEYTDPEIFESLRRVHLIPSEDSPEETPDTINANVFRNLDSVVSEGGENFSTGEKQLLCMARAILKRSRVLATASVDYATDELISKTIRQEFATSTILTIAHRLRTVIDYDRVMILDTGRIVEFDRPATLLADPNSSFYRLCKATGKKEFSVLKRMAGAV